MKKLLTVLLALLSFQVCFCTTTKLESDTTLYYRDAFSNLYKITKGSLIYTPITAIESSSGMYSGGNSWAVEITIKEYHHFTYLFFAAKKDKASQHLKLVKPNPVLSIRIGKKESRFILDRNADMNIEINNTINIIRKNK
jgi:hypothetical protein